MKILLVDDHAVVRQGYASLLPEVQLREASACRSCSSIAVRPTIKATPGPAHRWRHKAGWRGSLLRLGQAHEAPGTAVRNPSSLPS